MKFGTQATLLPNGNIVVTDPEFAAPGPINAVGAVFLYEPDGDLISTVRGSTANDRVGSSGVTVVGDSNFVIASSGWDNPSGAVTNAGAATWVNGVTGLNGVVSFVNSLVGTQANDGSSMSILALANGNYLVARPSWHNAALQTGAVTFGNGNTGISGAVTVANSLVGSHDLDGVGGGQGGIALPNGNYVVIADRWDNGTTVDAGAVTFGNGDTGVSGTISSANSLVASTADSFLAAQGITLVGNSNFVVRSDSWNNGATLEVGAVTFVNGSTGLVGNVSASNSLIGSNPSDFVGYDGIFPLSNGGYVVNSQEWDNGAVINAGAMTQCPPTGCVGVVSATNSLVGSKTDDLIGNGGIETLSNGNYVVLSPDWDNGATAGAGAATFVNSGVGISGAVSSANSLVGANAGDNVGDNGLRSLSNGNYVTFTPGFKNGAATDAGAVTLGNGTTGVAGLVSVANSLVGTTTGDGIAQDVFALSNGNFVVANPRWDNVGAVDVGALTWVNGVTGRTGAVSVANSLTGTSALDFSSIEIKALSNGNCIAMFFLWNDGATADVGAAMLLNGSSTVTGTVSAANALIGSNAGDEVGRGRAFALSNGHAIVSSPNWKNPNTNALAAGAATFVNGQTGITGPVTANNSLVGSSAGDAVSNNRFYELRNAAGSVNYVVRSPSFANGAAAFAGALTVGNGLTGIVGPVGVGNSIVGTSSDDSIGGFSNLTVFANGNFVEDAGSWDNVGLQNAGAVALGLFGGTAGAIGTDNSVLGEVSGLGGSHPYAYDQYRNQLIVGQKLSNRVILHRPGIATTTGSFTDTPDPSGDGVPTAFRVAVSAAIRPNAGRVTFTASTGESCVDTTPAFVSNFVSAFTCDITFITSGTRQVVAEYTGSNGHSYSRSDAFPHTANTSFLFGNSFE